MDETNPEYWDCNCEKEYIHRKDVAAMCGLCHAHKDDQPDSHTSEIGVKGKMCPACAKWDGLINKER